MDVRLISEWVNEWVVRIVREWVIGSVSVWVSGWIVRIVSECVVG